MQFASPHYLWLLTLLAPMTAYYVCRTMQGGAAIRISTVAGVLHAPKTVRHYLRHLPFALRAAAFTLLVVALARPQDIEQNVRTNTEGIDIVLAIDVSASMLARDFRPDRITAAKEVAGSFVADRYGDRIGLVVFAAEAFTQSPLTTDQSTLQTLLARIRSGLIDDSGTAIGNGLATAINRLRESEAKSKVIILLTDGVNNRGQIAPMTAAEIARAQGIRVYTIGVGTEGTAPYPAVDIYGQPTGDVVMAKVEIDEKTLGAMADLTGGKYFRATDNAKLKAIYDEINQLEKSKVEVTERISYHERFLVWALAALGALLLEFLLSNLVLKRIP
ncbi:VWA domain-containing protein [uncultured Alistipes sp.]|uniref:vWA domain-containing protein n=1 Tax=uncultured Alistipes sp. TaxID=538949 RepID=UPI00266D3FC7|nr:VWA domain-containing protein [uncultured Alistipes sp.]